MIIIYVLLFCKLKSIARDGRMDAWVGGWVGGWMDEKAILWTADGNQKF